MKTVYKNGKVYTGTLPLVEAFAVEDDKFIFAGSNEEAAKIAADEVVDLNGAFVCSGFNDSHMHLLGFGGALTWAQLGQHTTSLEGMISYMKDFLKDHPVREGGWLRGRGWNHDYYMDVKRMPNRYDLDRISTEVPIVATRCCGHIITVNSKALEVCGITEDTPEIPGGVIGYDENGKLDGTFSDAAMELIYSKVPSPSKEDVKDYIRAACKALNSYGVTSSQTDDYCLDRNIPYTVINEAYKELEESGELTVRVCEQCNIESVEALQEFLDAGNKSGVGSDNFKLGPLKMLGDGSLGARTAFMTRAYADKPGEYGTPIFTQKQMDDMVSLANKNGMNVAIHAIGDACLDRVINAIDNALTECPREDHRHGVIHCQISRQDQLDRMVALNMHIYMQSIFIDYDINIVEDRVGKERAATSYRWKYLKDHGLSVSNGTDCPVELPFALGGIQCLVTRQNMNKKHPVYLEEEKFSVQDAIDSYTIKSAEASFDEKIKGYVTPGHYADFVVLDKNPMEVDPFTIKDIKVCATYMGGKKVYQG